MLEQVRHYLVQRGPTQLARDALDIFLVYYVVYRALLVLRGTRAMQIGVGLGVVFVLYLVANFLELVTTLSILGALLSSIILIIVVVFQNDIRRGLMRVGSRAIFSPWTKARETKVIDEVVEAATELARHRIGAIITFEQDANLDEFVGAHKGHDLDANVSAELLVSLFLPEGINKLHDGAVVIRHLRIAKAGVFFPMPEARVLDESFGSRHRAALGITEETDAVVVVVSEERGTISFCFNGNIASNLDGPKLRSMLEAIFNPKSRSKKTEPAATRVSLAPPPPDGTDEVSSDRPSATIDTPVSISRDRISQKEEEHDEAISEEAPESVPPAPLRPRVVVDGETPPPSAARLSNPIPLRASGAKPVEVLMPRAEDLASDEEQGPDSGNAPKET